MDWQVVKEIIELYEEVEYEQEMDERDWMMDEDQMGIKYPNHMSKEDMYHLVTRIYNQKHSE